MMTRSFLFAFLLLAIVLAIGSYTYSSFWKLGASIPHKSSKQEKIAIKGIGIIGDSQSDEYQANDKRGRRYAQTTLSWVEILAKSRYLPFGVWDTYSEPRRTGYAYNWARTGASTQNMIDSKAHIGLSEQISNGDVNLVILYIGASDFGLYNQQDGYLPIYNNEVSPIALQQKVDRVTKNIITAVETIQKPSKDDKTVRTKIILVTVPDINLHTLTKISFPSEPDRNRVSQAIAQVNANLMSYVKGKDIRLVDINSFYRQVIESSENGYLWIGNNKINTVLASDDPKHLFLGDVAHPGTILQSLFANYMLTHINTYTGNEYERLSVEEITTLSGIRQ